MGGKKIVLVAAHKPYRMPEDALYLPVQAGAAGKESIGYQRDDEGENISALNPCYCELTVIYWAWKNLGSEYQYIGLAHYKARRGSLGTGAEARGPGLIPGYRPGFRSGKAPVLHRDAAEPLRAYP